VKAVAVEEEGVDQVLIVEGLRWRASALSGSSLVELVALELHGHRLQQIWCSGAAAVVEWVEAEERCSWRRGALEAAAAEQAEAVEVEEAVGLKYNLEARLEARDCRQSRQKDCRPFQTAMIGADQAARPDRW